MLKFTVFDVEGNGLHPSKIWCLSASVVGSGKIVTTTDYDTMKKFLTDEKQVLIGHNIIRWDIPVLERILGIEIKAKLIDTLALSWVLEPESKRHGLEEWGEYFGRAKEVIHDWDNQTIEDYKRRCYGDVEINLMLWEQQISQLRELYEDDEENMWRYIDYLMFKMDCAREQERSRWKLDVERCEAGLVELKAEYDAKLVALADAMPKVKKYKTKTRPAKPFKKDGTYSAHGEKWFALLDEKGLPHDYDEEVEVFSHEEEPNPGSTQQIKNWLFDLGWEPQHFKYVRNKETNEVRAIPQVKSEFVDGEVCDSVKALFSKEPGLEHLNSIGIIKHRIDILKGYLDNVDEEGYIQAQIQGLTNTLRFKHRVVLNLPGVDKLYGELVRGCLIAPEGYELCGSDMSSLEDRTKQHYMYMYDPEYVESMMEDDFDPHIDLAVFAGALTKGQGDAHKQGIQDHSGVRRVYKAVNYACVYQAGGPTVARSAGVPQAEGYKLVDAYWKKNWSVKAIARDVEVKECLGRMWLFNPVSKFWYYLKVEKDIFSTLNQGTGVYCFDTWIKHFRKRRSQLTGQMHKLIVPSTGNSCRITPLIAGRLSA